MGLPAAPSSLILQLEYEKKSEFFGSPFLHAANASAYPAIVHSVQVFAGDPDTGKKAQAMFAPAQILLKPYSTTRIELHEVLDTLCRKLAESHELRVVRYWVVVRLVFQGERSVRATLPENALVFDGKFAPAETSESKDEAYRLTWEQGGVIP